MFGRGRLKWVLVGSLGLNLLVVGLIVGAVLRGPPDRAAAIPGLWHYARALPAPYRRDIGRTLRHNRHDWAGTREVLQSQRAAVAEALTADPFEIGRVAALLEEERRLTGELAGRGARVLLAQIERMSPAERAAYAEALVESRRRPGGRER